MNFRPGCVGKVLLVMFAMDVLGWVVMTLRNWVFPERFVATRVIDFVHMFGLPVLSGILFDEFRGAWRAGN